MLSSSTIKESVRLKFLFQMTMVELPLELLYRPLSLKGWIHFLIDL